MPHLEVHRPPTIELHHHDVLDTVAVVWTGMTRREMAGITLDRPHLSLRDVENVPTRTLDLLHAHHQDVVLHQLEVHRADAEEVRAIAPTAVTVEVGVLQEVAVQAEHAIIAGDSLPSSRLTNFV